MLPPYGLRHGIKSHFFSSGNTWLPVGPTQAAVSGKFTVGNPLQNQLTGLRSSRRARSACSSVSRGGNDQVPP